VPMVFAELGEDRILEIVQKQSTNLGLGNADPAWSFVLKFIVAWAEKELVENKTAKLEGTN
jgi:hypothetical protein